MKKSRTKSQQSPSQLIDARIRELSDWRGKTFARLRTVIRAAAPKIVEEWKWNVPVWSHEGLICTGETYKSVVKLTFAKGASLNDPSHLFNSSLEGNTRRAIDIHEGEKVNEKALKALVREAMALNKSESASKPRKAEAKSKKTPTKASTAPAKPRARTGSEPVVLLSGGNPQIAKGEGDAPVQEYIAAIPGWKRDIGRRLDELITRAVPGVRKAVRYNSPFYGVEGWGWFLSLHCFTKYIKVGFFRGTSLKPPPPGESKDRNMRYLDIYQKEPFDEAQFSEWVRQASNLPGWDGK